MPDYFRPQFCVFLLLGSSICFILLHEGTLVVIQMIGRLRDHLNQ